VGIWGGGQQVLKKLYSIPAYLFLYAGMLQVHEATHSAEWRAALHYGTATLQAALTIMHRGRGKTIQRG
jgi:hypothetical protein